MNPGITSKEAIVQSCREIAAEQGLSAISIRAVAEKSGIALGTLYNYYGGKDQLMLATVESIWQDIFHRDPEHRQSSSFPDYITGLFRRVRRGAEAYPNFLTDHSIAIAKSKRGDAKGAMEQCFAHMKTQLLEALRADPAVDRAVFSGALTEGAFVDLVTDNLLLLLIKGAPDCAALEALVRRVIYR